MSVSAYLGQFYTEVLSAIVIISSQENPLGVVQQLCHVGRDVNLSNQHL